jgi:exopolysaccharide production protein ExoZ
MNAMAHPPVARWIGIQYLRGLAACGVVIFHYFDGPMAPAGRQFALGQYGVDLFFVISGFIMYAVARTELVGRFLERRLGRIYPLYWVATISAVVAWWLVARAHPSGTEMAKSLALWPHFSESHPDHIWPILVPGWSLSYEL